MSDDVRHRAPLMAAAWTAIRTPAGALRAAAAILLVVLAAQGPITEAIAQHRLRALATAVAEDAAGMPILRAVLLRHPRAIEEAAVWRTARREAYVLSEDAIAARLAQLFDAEFDRGLRAAPVPALRRLAAAMADLADGAAPASVMSDAGCQARIGTLATGDSDAAQQVAALIGASPAGDARGDGQVGERFLDPLRSAIATRELDDCAALAALYRMVATLPDEDVGPAMRALLSPGTAR